MPVTVYGPPRCGKSRNAFRLAGYLGCSVIFDEPHERPLSECAVPEDALILTNVPTDGAVNFFDVMAEMAARFRE